MGVRTIQLTENKGALAGALVVREHQELVFISQNGMVQRTSVRGISRYGRASQGVKVMNIRDDDQVSAVALVAESEAEVPIDEDIVGGEDGVGVASWSTTTLSEGVGVEPIDDDVSDAVIAVELDDLEADDFETDEPGADVSDDPEPDDAG